MHRPTVPLRRLARLGVLILLLTGCAEKRVSEGIYHARQGDYPEAIAALRSAVDRAPDSAIAHYNLGFALSADAFERAETGRFDGTDDTLREANARFADAVALDPDDYAGRVSAAREESFRRLYNLAVDESSAGDLPAAERILELARVVTTDALSVQRTRVLGLQIEMSEALASSASDAHERTMRVLADLERIRTEGPADDALVDEIENTLARVRALLDTGPDGE